MRPQHRVGLARCCLPVHEHSPIVALQRGLGYRSHNSAIDLRRVHLRPEYIVELEALALDSILVPSSKFLLPDESVDVASVIQIEGQIGVERLDSALLSINTPDLLVFIGSKQRSKPDANLDALGPFAAS